MGTTFDKRASVAIPLEFPIELDGETISSITIRRPKVADTMWARKQRGDNVEQNVAMLARLCNVTPEHIAELDEYDAEKVQEQYNSFRGGTS